MRAVSGGEIQSLPIVDDESCNFFCRRERSVSDSVLSRETIERRMSRDGLKLHLTALVG